MYLRRLRDISQETEQEQRRRIAEMEKDVTSLDEIQCKWLIILLIGLPFTPLQHNMSRP